MRVVKKHGAIAEPAFVQQFELDATTPARQGLLAGSHDDRHDEQLVVVDNAALIAWAASSGPPLVTSRSDCAFSCRTALESKSRSIRVLSVRAAWSVLV